MPRTSIQQFRADLASRSEQSALVRAYRELARRRDVATGMIHHEWAVWPPVAAAQASA